VYPTNIAVTDSFLPELFVPDELQFFLDSLNLLMRVRIIRLSVSYCVSPGPFVPITAILLDSESTPGSTWEAYIEAAPIQLVFWLHGLGVAMQICRELNAPV